MNLYLGEKRSEPNRLGRFLHQMPADPPPPPPPVPRGSRRFLQQWAWSVTFTCLNISEVFQSKTLYPFLFINLYQSANSAFKSQVKALGQGFSLEPGAFWQTPSGESHREGRALRPRSHRRASRGPGVKSGLGAAARGAEMLGVINFLKLI